MTETRDLPDLFCRKLFSSLYHLFATADPGLRTGRAACGLFLQTTAVDFFS
jgi:hypothetical protein